MKSDERELNESPKKRLSDRAGYRTWHRTDHMASFYEQELYRPDSFDSWIWSRERELLDDITDRLVKKAGARYLDFACGTGRILSYLEGRFESSTGIDISSAMLRYAAQKIDTSVLIDGDATTDRDLAPGPFEIITAFRFFLNAEPPLRSAALQAIASRLSADGVCILNLHGNTWSLRGLSVTLRKFLLKQDVHQLSYPKLRRELFAHGLTVREVYGIGLLPKNLWRLAPYRIVDLAESLVRTVRPMKWVSTHLVLVCSPTRAEE